MCTKSISDYNYTSFQKGTLLQVQVKQTVPDKHLNSQESEMGEAKTVTKTIDLNKKLTDEMLNSIEIDDKLGHLLIMQDDTVEDHEYLNFGLQ